MGRYWNQRLLVSGVHPNSARISPSDKPPIQNGCQAKDIRLIKILNYTTQNRLKWLHFVNTQRTRLLLLTPAFHGKYADGFYGGDSGDGVFVHHLLSSVLFDDGSKVVKAPDNAFYLKTINQIYCYGDLFPPDLVQKRILHIELALGHQCYLLFCELG